MSSPDQNFTIRRGDDTPVIALALANADGTPADAPASWVWKYSSTASGAAIATKTGTSLVAVVMFGGTFLAVPITMSASETSALSPGQTYFHELHVVTAAGKNDTPLTGTMTVQSGIS